MTIKGGSAVAPLIGTIGDVGIGTESPTEKLEVNGTIKATELKVGSETLTESMLGKLSELTTTALYTLLTTITRPTFCIWAEENSDISSQSTKSEWSFGNGASGYPLSRGIVIGVRKCKVLSMTLDIGHQTNDDNSITPEQSTVQLTKNGTGTGFQVQTSFDYSAGRRTGYSTATTDIIFTGGQVVNFKTTQGGSNTNRGVVCVWFERLQ